MLEDMICIKENISRTDFFETLSPTCCLAEVGALTYSVFLSISTSRNTMLRRTLFAALLPALLNPLLTAAGICPECGANGYFYREPGCFNITYEAPLFGSDAGACFEIGGPASPFGESGPPRSVKIILVNEGCECMYQCEQTCLKKERVRFDTDWCSLRLPRPRVRARDRTSRES